MYRLIPCLVAVLFQLTGNLEAVAQEEIKPFGRRIVGGEKADIGDHPWQVALEIKIGGKTYLCGGSIVAARWVLSAAHCFTQAASPLGVHAKTDATDYVSDGVWVDVEKVVIHDNYSPITHENDLALVKLRSVPKGRVIPLATMSSELALGMPLEVTGWGSASEGANASSHLLKATVPYADNAVCNETTAYDGKIKPRMMCAGYREGGIDSCQGDSGGPLVWRTADGPVLVGVVSWGEGCARKLKYGVYVRVASYANWIRAVIAQE